MRCQLESRTQRVERLQDFETPFGLDRDRLLCRQREQRISPQLGSADAAAELVKLRKAETVGTMNDQCVGSRNIEAGLDDRGRQQHVIFAVVECRHYVVEYGG